VHGARAGQHLRIVVIAGVELRVVRQNAAHGGDQEGQHGELGIAAAIGIHHRPGLLERGDIELLDQSEMRDAALGLLHILRDLAPEADDLDDLVLALGGAGARH
jgi:hypothetical protein